MSHSMNAIALSIKPRCNCIEVSGMTRVIAAIDGIRAKVGKLQQSCISGWNEEWNIG